MKRLVTACLMGLAALLPVTAFAQQRPLSSDELRQIQADAERVRDIANVEAHKEAFVADLVARWSTAARERGMDAFDTEMPERLMEFPAAKLMRLAELETFSEFNAFVLTGGRAQILGDITQDLVFFPLPACRLLDTRFGTVAPYNAPLAPNTEIQISVNDSIGVQGGNPANCGVPGADPPALAVVVSAVSPTGPGNLRTYATGGTIPNASLLTYTAGTTISAGAITESCTSCGTELTVRNQGGGTAHVVVDVVGYFHAPIQTPLECSVVSTNTLVAANTAYSVLSGACPTGTIVSGGGCNDQSTFTGHWFWQNGPNVTTGTPTQWQCRGNNTNGFAMNMRAYAVCCNVPGR